MVKIIASDDFINVISDLSLRHINVLTKSFISIEKVSDEEVNKQKENSFLNDLLEQIKNQEVE